MTYHSTLTDIRSQQLTIVLTKGVMVDAVGLALVDLNQQRTNIVRSQSRLMLQARRVHRYEVGQ